MVTIPRIFSMIPLLILHGYHLDSAPGVMRRQLDFIDKTRTQERRWLEFTGGGSYSRPGPRKHTSHVAGVHRKLFHGPVPASTYMYADTPSQTQLFRPLRTHQEGRVRQSRPKPTRIGLCGRAEPGAQGGAISRLLGNYSRR